MVSDKMIKLIKAQWDEHFFYLLQIIKYGKYLLLYDII